MAAGQGLDLLAISMAVALPDICVSLISDDGRSDGPRYKAWCADNLKTGFNFISPQDLWSMRCGVLHNGRFGDMKHSVSRVIFLPPGGDQFIDGKLGDAYLYSAQLFCLNINRAVVAWLEANHDHPNIVANSDRVMHYRPHGFPPYIQGRTVIA